MQPTLIWGRVLKEGEPVTGVNVRSEMSPETYPLYFGEDYLPDPKRDTTSGNGIFVFVGLPKGFHPLLATKKGFYWSHMNIPVTAEAMGYAEIQGSSRDSATDLLVFDALTQNPVSAELTLQSLDEVIEVPPSGLQRLSLPYLQRQSFMIHRGNENYLPSLHSYIDSQDYIYAPLISRDFLQGFSEELNLNQKQTGQIIGFVEGDDFSVSWNDGLGTDVEVVYFNAAGEVVESGVAGGGFLIPNIKPGAGSLTVLGKLDPFIHSQVSAAERGLVSVHYFQLGRF